PDQDGIDGRLRKKAGEGVVVARDHRKLAAFGLGTQKIGCGHSSPQSRANGARYGDGEVARHRLGTCQNSIKSWTYMRPGQGRKWSHCRCLTVSATPVYQRSLRVVQNKGIATEVTDEPTRLHRWS